MLIPALSVAAALLAPQSPERVRQLATLELRSATPLEPRAARAALAARRATWEVLKRAPDDESCVEALARLLADEYWSEGRHDARVAGRVADGAFVLEVEQGPVFACGAVEVQGAEALPADRLEALLREPAGNWPGFPTGGVPDCSDRFREQAAARLREHYLEFGRHGLRCGIGFRRGEGTLDLVAAIEDEGQLLKVGRVELVGDAPEQTAAALARLEVPADAVYSAAFAAEMRRRLDRLGRYEWIAMPRPEPGAAGAIDPFAIHVRSADYAPALADTRWDDLHQLWRAFDWIGAHFDAGRTLRLEGALTEAIALGPLAVAPGTVELHLGREGFALWVSGVRWPDGAVRPACLALWRGGCLCWDGTAESGENAFAKPLSMRMRIATAPSAPGEARMELRWTLGLSTAADEGAVFGLELHPLTATYLLHGGGVRFRREGEDLVHGEGDDALRIAPAGEVRGRLALPGIAASFCAETLEQVLAGRRARFADARPRPVEEWLGGRLRSLLVGRLEAAPMVEALLEAAAAHLRAQRDDGAPHRGARLHARDTSAQDCIAGFARLAAVAEGLPAWLRRQLIATADLFGGEDARLLAGHALELMAQEPGPGPLALLAASAGLRYAGRAAAGDRCARAGLERCTFAAAFADLELLLACTRDLADAAQWADGLGAHWRAEPRLAELFAGLPADAPPREALRRGLEVLWDAGLDDLLRAALVAG